MADRVVDRRRALGRWGEDVAARHLQEGGAEVLERNWRCREGELDLVVRDGDAIVFVEVKTRSGRGYGEPAEAVTRLKARRIHLLAARWLAEHRPPGGPWDLRFDVVSVLRTADGPEVVHLHGAF
jgi:putative endonuclease